MWILWVAPNMVVKFMTPALETSFMPKIREKYTWNPFKELFHLNLSFNRRKKQSLIYDILWCLFWWLCLCQGAMSDCVLSFLLDLRIDFRKILYRPSANHEKFLLQTSTKLQLKLSSLQNCLSTTVSSFSGLCRAPPLSLFTPTRSVICTKRIKSLIN